MSIKDCQITDIYNRYVHHHYNTSGINKQANAIVSDKSVGFIDDNNNNIGSYPVFNYCEIEFKAL